MVGISNIMDLSWLWVCIGVGAFLTVVAVCVYAVTADSRPAKSHRQERGTAPDGSHERLEGDKASDRSHALV
jgi:hypothetical protein